ncbi:hypothetical protein FHS36_002790 [Streptomyces eurocidicus]|uniref:Uncharacterized protein n=1 Tax=Streptomyces eurocidicus TaxID=66423 RepID=A0A7W8F2C7_STREU|nr:hypothetical protein [Streptomyces eurocidicus]
MHIPNGNHKTLLAARGRSRNRVRASGRSFPRPNSRRQDAYRRSLSDILALRMKHKAIARQVC